jgi:hypothetical protein
VTDRRMWGWNGGSNSGKANKRMSDKHRAPAHCCLGIGEIRYLMLGIVIGLRMYSLVFHGMLGGRMGPKKMHSPIYLGS